jgi:hypothetical protein
MVCCLVMLARLITALRELIVPSGHSQIEDPTSGHSAGW